MATALPYSTLYDFQNQAGSTNSGSTGGATSPAPAMTAAPAPSATSPVAAAPGAGLVPASPVSGWLNENDSVASRVAQLQSQDSDLMRGATSAGLRTANRRGLINSSMGVGAGVAAGLGAITPIASQDAQQAYGRRMAAVEDMRAREVSNEQIRSNDRASYSQTAGNIASGMQSAIANTLTNDKIPAATRAQVQADMTALYRSQMNQLASLYGAQLSWG